MPSLESYNLHFKGGLHLGTRGINLTEASEFIPSDTLFAALMDVWNRLGGDVKDFVAPYRNDPDPPFLLTSAFPFAGGVRFFPIPADLRRVLSATIVDDPEYRKPLRKMRYFSEGLLRKALNGPALDSDLFPLNPSEDPKTGIALQGGELWLLKDEVNALPEYFRYDDGNRKRSVKALRYLNVWKNGEVPRVTIDRIAQASTLYHVGRVTFADGCGLWLGVQWRDKTRTFGTSTYEAALTQALQTLQDDGIGGERSSGYGAFTLKSGEKISLPDAKKGDAGYLLSRYHPTVNGELPGALNHANAAYQLVNVGGWLHTYNGANQRRKKLWMVETGSLVQIINAVQGSIEDVRPEYTNDKGEIVSKFVHEIWRYGFALPVGGLTEVKNG